MGNAGSGEMSVIYLQLRPREIILLSLVSMALLSGVIYAATSPLQAAHESAGEGVSYKVMGAASIEDDFIKAGLSKTDVIFLIRGGETLG